MCYGNKISHINAKVFLIFLSRRLWTGRIYLQIAAVNWCWCNACLEYCACADIPDVSLSQFLHRDYIINPLNAELNPICHLLALLGCATIVVVSKLRVKDVFHNCTAFYPLNAELNPICHLLALLGGATIVVVSRLRVKQWHFVDWCGKVVILRASLLYQVRTRQQAPRTRNDLLPIKYRVEKRHIKMRGLNWVLHL